MRKYILMLQKKTFNECASYIIYIKAVEIYIILHHHLHESVTIGYGQNM